MVVGAEKFSAYKSTPVLVSHYHNKLYIIENKKDGICLGEALPQKPSPKPHSVIAKSQKRLTQNEVELMGAYLQSQQMSVDMTALIACYRNGLGTVYGGHKLINYSTKVQLLSLAISSQGITA